ncbi:AGL289Cp [Eremothecium gossypii ATCC 10895]|uniref:AGL289Cp n=1 Tax=Eremothecium gossypii (strain ATCC 10895 / CBS 109.51 / FGSC 9923 / NRRL Y-1056) TaxID=284811 RepID=Q751J5_EREGS|nr:AGL289Cp [Eremothecium gossypii ATCC 10895]AAS54202.1 AGL289Cp [Eremothecium gossypii ATCC 10895]AEY98528.1 FAGL289Cp [Eremothecium gossypii FDAG1]
MAGERGGAALGAPLGGDEADGAQAEEWNTDGGTQESGASSESEAPARKRRRVGRNRQMYDSDDSDYDGSPPQVAVGDSAAGRAAAATARADESGDGSQSSVELADEGSAGGGEEPDIVYLEARGPVSGSVVDVEAEARLQQVVEIPDEEVGEEQTRLGGDRPVECKKAMDYKCPICFDPPEAALMTPCGHIYCTVCLFQMVNSSRGYRRNGQCALCRKDVKLKEVGLVVLRKKRVRKQSAE